MPSKQGDDKKPYRCAYTLGANEYEDERVRDLPISVLVAQCRCILAGELGAVLASHQGLHPGIITNNSHHKTNHCHYNNFMPK